ncbi:hypothetical protein QR680_007209 [Steinernema hermaphroditum]|uniref:Uncharacterized protein n=1 Tax=Steinernema hermaphroditum TaxID=289476 RepID=A0AA39HY23_9BILA|nr:hypothetical protein QR680_007209 [Steinernema hermaphroditum]
MYDLLALAFNRLLDFAAVFSITANCIAITVILKCTPKNMKNFARFLLNIMVWNFVVNLIFVVAHPYPMLPLVCFRLDGLLPYFVDSELLGHVFFGIALLVIVNVATAIFLSFQFRFMAIAYSRDFLHINHRWGYVYCGALHIICSIVYIVLYQTWPVKAENYKPTIPDDQRANLFCFDPDGCARNRFVITFFAFIFLIVCGVMTFVFLSFYHMQKHKALIGKNTLKMQRVLLWNLIILSAIPITLGAIPFLFAVLTIIFHDLPQSQVSCTVCIMILINYGPIMCIASLCVFKKYQMAVVQMVFRILRRPIPDNWAMGPSTKTNIAALKSEFSICPPMKNNWIDKK